jgi:hypothetical protein
MSELLWVTVPGGIVGTGAARQAVLRVLVTPKLDGGTLADNGMEQWPPLSLTTAPLVVDFAASVDGPVQEVQVMPPHIRPQLGVWEAFFSPDTVVRPPSPHSDAAPQVVVDGTSETAQKIDDTFTAAAGTLLRLDHPEDRKTLDDVVLGRLAANWSDEPPPRPPPVLPSPPIFQPPEFHQTLAKLREHPAVLRALGLIIEFTLPVAALPLASGVTKVRWPAAPTSAPALPTIVSPWTQFDDRMLPAATQNISAGMVTLTDDRWKMVNVDVDSAARRLGNAAQASKAGADAATFPLPALRTAGLMLVRAGRQVDFDTRRQAAAVNARRASMDAAVLTADDLVLGYRIDVLPQNGDWASLNARDATYTVQSLVTANATQITIGGGPAREEGHVKAFAAVDDGGGELRADEVVTRWTGWSVTVPLPGRQDAPLNPGMPFAFRWEFHVPKATLPPLRFNTSYNIRARVADLAGGGLDVADPAARFSLPAIYLRYEPIASPQLALPEGLDAGALGPGESIEQVVMRDDGGAGGTDLPSRTRVLTAPREPLRLAEQHGSLNHKTPEQIVDLVRQAIGSGTPSNEVLFPDVAADGVCAFPRQEPGGLDVQPIINSPWSGAWPDLEPKEVVLRERGAGQDVLAWESLVADQAVGDRLAVRLAKAEQLTLELSSPPTDSCRSHFATMGIFPVGSQESAIAGRHPMITPARAVTFTFPVRRPLADPAGTFTVQQRNEGETFAVLVPAPALLGIDVNSTAKLEIDATWMELNGNGTTTSFTAPVHTSIVNRGDQTLKEIRHELGDTRRRTITYAATAVSRFRRFFATSEDDAAFCAKAALAAPVVIPSSARPPKLVVRSTRPAFKWLETVDPMPAFRLVRQRLGGYLRLELGGPWYQTGEGEQLAVIVASDDDPDPDPLLWPLLSQVGLDPIRDPAGEPPVRFPTSEYFVDAGDPVAVVDRDSGNTVTALPYQPWCNAGRWFVDVALPSSAYYTFWPFVQLAVARYQPDSLSGLEISAIARTEMVQLMPERTLIVRRTGNDVFVSLVGPVPGPGTGFPSFEVVLERLQVGPGVSADAIDLTALAPPTDGTPAWVSEGDPQSAPLGTTELHFAIQPGSSLARVRIAEICTITDAVGLPDGDPVSFRTEFSDVVMLPQP